MQSSEEKMPLLPMGSVKENHQGSHPQEESIWGFLLWILFILKLGIVFSIAVSFVYIIDVYRSQEDESIIYLSPQESDDSCSGVSCTVKILSKDCTNTAHPVLGGLDLVEYFSFANTSFVGGAGLKEFGTVFGNYTFYFKSSANMEQFQLDPIRYLPAYGGFCAYGISNEFCPDFPYTSSCLGPGSNWAHYCLLDDKLFFFRHSSVKQLFLDDYSNMKEAGDERWNRWFPISNEKDYVFTTNCFLNISRPDDDVV
jgi:hypothetical protein